MDSGFYTDNGAQLLHQQPPSSSGSSGPARTSSIATEKKRETRRRTKTGCLTCRKRRIKCDEGKPECMRCTKSKRVCEGYSVKTVFRNENQLHYQQNIKPTPTTTTIQDNNHSHPRQSIQFSMPQYQPGPPAPENYHTFALPQFGHTGNPAAAVQPKKVVDSVSRNSSTSNASGISGTSDQRRISVLSLMSSERNDSARSHEVVQPPPSARPRVPPRTPETDARDNYYYNYFVSYHAYTLAKISTVDPRLDPSSLDHPAILWPQIIPALINEDPPGRRPLFDAVIAYTAHIRFEEIPIDFDVRSTGGKARLLELGIKAYLDIIRGTSETLASIDEFFTEDDPIRIMFRWGFLQHIVVQILADTNPRVAWVNYLGQKAFGSAAYRARSEVQNFYLAALRTISSHGSKIPQSVLDLQHRYEFMSTPGMDMIFFAFIKDFDALRHISYHTLSNPRLDNIYIAYRMINGGRLRGEANLDLLANELMSAVRQTS